jgi:glycosyltransferase involved in cell wall biosynthesis
MGGGGTFEGMARIALNGRLLVPGKLEGIGKFTLRCLQELVRLRPQDEFLLVVDRPDDEMFHLGPNVEVRRIRIPGRRPWLLRWWFGSAMRRVLKQWEAEAFVSLEGPLVSGMPDDFLQLSVIHDLNFEHHPEWIPSAWASYYQTEFRAVAHRAQVLCTVSEFSRDDLAAQYGRPKENIRIIPNAADHAFQPLDEAGQHAARTRFAGGKNYWVYIGSFHPRKNLPGLLSAYQTYMDAGGSWDLVLVGEAMWQTPEWPQALLDTNRVHTTGRLDEFPLAQALGGASGMVFVPWFEGFGIPLVEAMAAGVPVVASDVTSLPEVGGDAVCAWVDPGNPVAISEAMLHVEAHPQMCAERVATGLARAKTFSWQESGQKLDAAVDNLLQSSRNAQDVA